MEKKNVPSDTANKASKARRPPTESGRTVFSELIFPEQANHYGTLIGGRALHLMDVAAFAAASRVARCNVVTAGCDDVRFLEPAHIGELAEVVAEVTEVGGRSYHVAVTLHAENLKTGARRLCVEGRFVCVAVVE